MIEFAAKIGTPTAYTLSKPATRAVVLGPEHPALEQQLRDWLGKSAEDRCTRDQRQRRDDDSGSQVPAKRSGLSAGERRGEFREEDNGDGLRAQGNGEERDPSCKRQRSNTAGSESGGGVFSAMIET